jgi:hypothetical protein
MTQELVLVVLLTGLIGLLWVMTLSIMDGDHPASEHHEPASSGHSEGVQHQESALKHHTVAA